jgi:CheY-like chemotaxis protein
MPPRVLIVDDHADTAESLSLWLRRLGYETHVAGDGERGLEAAGALKPHAVLLDLTLPVLDGYEVARRLRAEPDGQAVTLVAVSGRSLPEEQERSRQAGFDHFLVKPVDFDLLQRALARAVAGAAAPIS